MDNVVEAARSCYAGWMGPAVTAGNGGETRGGECPSRRRLRDGARFAFNLPRSFCILALTALLAAGTHGQVLVADYQFQGNLNSTVPGAPALALLGNSRFTNDVVDGLARTAVYFPAGDGLALSNAESLLSIEYSVVVLFRFDTNGGWHRLMDFKNRTTDGGLYRFYDNLSFINLGAGAGGSVKPNSYVQATLTRSFAGEVNGYINGNREMTFNDAGGDAILSGEQVLSFFRDDLLYPNESAAGAVARIRIYSVELSPGQVAELDRLPDATGRQRPIVTSALSAQSAVGVPFRFQITASNNPDSYSATGLPEWASLNHLTGEISGTPSTTGVHTVGVSAHNAAGSDARTLTLSITDFTLTAEATGGVPNLIIQGPAGQRYAIEFVEAIPPSGAWRLLTNLVAFAPRSIVTDLTATNAAQRFYRAALMQ
jgi:hypothetical protein